MGFVEWESPVSPSIARSPFTDHASEFTSTMRLLWLALVLAAAVIAVFLAWGGEFERWFSGAAAIAWIRSCGAWGWLAVIALLVSDLFLPVPATPLMTAAGYVYGAWAGGAISAAGSFSAGVLAYELCAGLGYRAAAKIVGPADLARGERIFQERGAWLVALSRALPVLPEVIACLAGLTRMPRGKFCAALACGALPMGFIYAAIGASGQEQPGLALALSALIPALLWLVAQRLVRAR